MNEHLYRELYNAGLPHAVAIIIAKRDEELAGDKPKTPEIKNRKA